MIRLISVTYIFFSLFMLAIMVLNLVGLITFGYGIEDSQLLIMLALKFGLITIFFVMLRKSPPSRIQYLFFAAVFITVFFVMLKITLFRSRDYPWDGNLFII
jgi:uncharacterized BrkB/YihY/UPF0761 family membrane protein